MGNDIVFQPTIGKFSRVRTVDLGAARLVFLSGTATIGEAAFDIRAQTEIVFKKLNQLLHGEGGNLSHLLKITAFLTDMREYDGYNDVRNRVFADIDPPPASSSVEAKLVYPELRIEVEGVAVIPNARS